MVEGSIMRHLPVAVQAALAKMNNYEQSMFVEEYKRRKKSIGFAYFLWIIFGLHYGYVHKWGVQLCFWISLGGVFLWWIISLFIIPKMVRDYNRDIAVDVMRSQKIMTS